MKTHRHCSYPVPITASVHSVLTKPICLPGVMDWHLKRAHLVVPNPLYPCHQRELCWFFPCNKLAVIIADGSHVRVVAFD